MKVESRAAMADVPWLVPLSAVVLVGSWFTNADQLSHEKSILAVSCASAAVASLFVGLRAPRVGVVLNALAVGAFLVIDLEDGPIHLTLAAAAFLAASRLETQLWMRALYVAGALVGSAVLFKVAFSGGELVQLIAVAGVMAAGAAFGSLLRTRRLADRERTRAAATEEQLRMAQDLHDGVGHGLAVIAMQAGVGLHVLEKDPGAVRSALEAIRDTARESLDALRIELSQLAGEPAGLRPHRGLADLDVLLDRIRAAGLAVRVTGLPGALPETVDATAYAVVQEALTNVLRHAHATSVVVTLDRSARALTVTVADDGRGGSVQDEGMGLRGMRERVDALGGSLSAGPRPEGGFVLRAELPL